jgi:protein-disulfide isomerase
MVRKMILVTVGLVFQILFLTVQGFSQEDKIVRVAIETIKTQARLPQGVEVRFIEKKESPIEGFYSVKLIFMAPDKEIPAIVYVDKEGEKVILGHLFIKGENVTKKEAGEPKPRKIDMALLEVDKSPFRGPAQAKIAIVEFSNFQCPYCVKSWAKMKELLEKYPRDIKYVFKQFPLQGKTSELPEMVAATQAISDDAFWVVHDFFFSEEGQGFINGGKDVLKHKVEEILKEKGFDVKTFQTALSVGKGKSRVEEDAAVGRRVGVSGTPTAIVNGDFVGSQLTEKTIEKYLEK